MIVIGIALATIAAFIISFVFYAVASPAGPGAESAADGRPRPWQMLVELARSAIVAGLIAGLLSAADWEGVGQGALLGLVLWALPVVLLTGSVVWERVPVSSAALHAGDWLIKLIAIGAVVGIFI